MSRMLTVSLIVLATAALLAGCTQRSTEAQTSTTEQQTGTLDNPSITMKVKTAFMTDPNVSALRINVDTEDGVVTLTGTVGSEREKDLAVEIARTVEGVSEVRNNLAIEMAGAAPEDKSILQSASDAAITAKVKASLALKRDVKAHNIDVDTHDGVVTLTGIVSGKAEHDLALQTSRKIDGVKDVVDNLKIQP